MTFLKIENEKISIWLSMFLGSVAVINPLAAITIIPPFRHKVKRILKIKTKTTSIASTPAVVGDTTSKYQSTRSKHDNGF